MTFPSRDECLYTSCYCEENVYQLCSHISKTDENLLANAEKGNFEVVFVSNESRMIPLFSQKSARVGSCVIWDYHVILVEKQTNGNSFVWDLDTTLEFPCSFEVYMHRALCPHLLFPGTYERKYRVIGCNDYLETFSSDRSHMMRPDGTWSSPPPFWDPVYKSVIGNNIQDFISMKSTGIDAISVVYNESGFIDRYMP